MNNLALSGGGQINYDLATTGGSDLINLVASSGAGGNLTLTGTTNINVANISTLASNPSYRLMNVGGTITGTTNQLNLLNVPGFTRRTFNITFNTGTAPKQVNLSVIGSNGNLTWVGGSSSTSRDVFDSGNKIWSGSEPDNYFYNFDDVTFNDNSSYNTVNIAPDDGTHGFVTPSSITVENNTKNYTFAGFKITGITGLYKTGTGTLTLVNAGSDFTGAITINNGVLQIGDGPGNNYGSLGTGAISNSGQLVFYQNGSTRTTLSNAISGTGSLEQKGTNTLTVSGSNNYSGVTLITSGTLQPGNNAALGTTVGGTTISSGATLDINNRNLALSRLPSKARA